jgi:hypothetical protein
LTLFAAKGTLETGFFFERRDFGWGTAGELIADHFISRLIFCNDRFSIRRIKSRITGSRLAPTFFLETGDALFFAGSFAHAPPP